MSSSRFLDVQYSLSKSRFLKKPSRMFSSRDRQKSGGLIATNTEELKGVFNIFDSNKDGKISQNEYKAILKALEENTKEVEKIFKVADSDCDGFIDFNEFVEVQKKAGGMKPVDLQRAFQLFDKDNDGKITAGDVQDFLKRLGETHSLEDCKRMVEAVDSKGDGVVDFDEFTNMMTRNLIMH